MRVMMLMLVMMLMPVVMLLGKLVAWSAVCVRCLLRSRDVVTGVDNTTAAIVVDNTAAIDAATAAVAANTVGHDWMRVCVNRCAGYEMARGQENRRCAVAFIVLCILCVNVVRCSSIQGVRLSTA